MPPALPPDTELIAALRAGDEAAFGAMLDAWTPSLRRLARSFVRTESSVEEVVQETWTAVVLGLPKFEGRSSLKTWVFTILANRSRTRGSKDARTVPESAVGEPDSGPLADRFTDRGTWLRPPQRWQDFSAEAVALSKETVAVLERALEDLPPRQRAVVLLRDAEGVEAQDACILLEISESNQRVLLHRGRSRLRCALEDHLAK
jgi:RNA polymerase sigma-70 factor (ECF subfamily)